MNSFICLFRQNTYLRNKKHISPAKVETFCFKVQTTGLVVSWGSGKHPPKRRRLSCHSFLNRLTVYTALKVVACCSEFPCVFHRWMCLVFLRGRTTLDCLKCFPSLFYLSLARRSRCVRESTSNAYQSKWLAFCNWCRGRGVASVNASVPLIVDFFRHLVRDKGLSVPAVRGYRASLNSVLGAPDVGLLCPPPIFRDPRPTCVRCRGVKCTSDVTCDICKNWSVGQWEAFLKKRSYSVISHALQAPPFSLRLRPFLPSPLLLRKLGALHLLRLLPPFLQRGGVDQES